MINFELGFKLPEPWSGKSFHTKQLGAVNFLVGPNGSGKSRFASTLKGILPNARMLSTDRMQGMEGAAGLRSIFGDQFSTGLAKNHFGHLKNSGSQFGTGVDSLILLEERLDLRIQVEATLSHLFNRRIALDWDSGHLVARASLGRTGTSYRLDREECHGIKELLILLTHLYNDEHSELIIDEPELNLHPQYQSFFMQEVRRMAGDPRVDRSKKVIFLITHSPFILDFRSMEDVKSVISFDLRHESPRHLFDLSDIESSRISPIVPRLNVHHKQLFFSDNPVFVEGILDARLVSALQEARGGSVAGAGSCIVDAGGCEEVNHYLRLCLAFGKSAYFLYDLDSLFRGNLRSCIRSDGTVQSFLSSVGVGNDFAKYCGDLDSRLTALIDMLLATKTIPESLNRLVEFLSELGPRRDWTTERHSRARTAALTAISRHRAEVANATSEAMVADIEGRLNLICEALRKKNVLLLPGGTLERYLPSYTGDHYSIADAAKSASVDEELRVLSTCLSASEMERRYGVLFELICALPAKPPVDVSPVLMDYVASYIHALQGAIVSQPDMEYPQVRAYMESRQKTTEKIFSLESMTRSPDGRFNAVVKVASMLGQPARTIPVSDDTNAGMRRFTLVDALEVTLPES